MNEIIIFGESNAPVTSSCAGCTGCSDNSNNQCTEDINNITSEQLTKQLEATVKRANLENIISVEFKDIHTTDLTEYSDVKTLINMSFSFPILTVNKKIKYMGPFDSEIVLLEIKKTLNLE